MNYEDQQNYDDQDNYDDQEDYDEQANNKNQMSYKSKNQMNYGGEVKMNYDREVMDNQGQEVEVINNQGQVVEVIDNQGQVVEVINNQGQVVEVVNQGQVVGVVQVTGTYQRPTEPQSWSYGLCSCCEECSLCRRVSAHPWCAAGEITERVSDSFFIGFLTMACCPLFRSCVVTRAVRDKYNIEGGHCSDFMLNWCCHVCQATREYREVMKQQPETFGENFQPTDCCASCG